MMKVEQIKLAIINLSLPEFTTVRKWIDEFYAEQWDRQIEQDIKAGKLDKLAAEALADFEAGLCEEVHHECKRNGRNYATCD